MGSASGFRCVRSTTALNYDEVEPLEMVRFSGVIQAGDLEKLEGRALYVSIFDAEDADANGMVAPGRSPVAEKKLFPIKIPHKNLNLKFPRGVLILYQRLWMVAVVHKKTIMFPRVAAVVLAGWPKKLKHQITRKIPKLFFKTTPTTKYESQYERKTLF